MPDDSVAEADGTRGPSAPGTIGDAPGDVGTAATVDGSGRLAGVV